MGRQTPPCCHRFRAKRDKRKTQKCKFETFPHLVTFLFICLTRCFPRSFVQTSALHWKPGEAPQWEGVSIPSQCLFAILPFMKMFALALSKMSLWEEMMPGSQRTGESILHTNSHKTHTQSHGYRYSHFNKDTYLLHTHTLSQKNPSCLQEAITLWEIFSFYREGGGAHVHRRCQIKEKIQTHQSFSLSVVP